MMAQDTRSGPAADASPAATRAATLLAVLAWLAATAWARPLMLPDEGRYVGVAWEMLRSGDWLTPTLNGLPYFHKPPLFYWITAASMAVLGPNELAARLAPLLGATLAALALYAFTRRWCGQRSARLALLALLAQPLFFVGGQFANLDMLVAGCISATVLLCAHAALAFEAGRPDRRALLAAYAMAALGVLAKGLIGGVLPVLVIGSWLLLRRRWRTLWAVLSLPGLLLFALIAMPWFVAMQLRFSGFLHYFFGVHHVQRFTTGSFNNVHPFWFYPAVLLAFTLPWWPWLLRALRARPAPAGPGAAVHTLMLVWLVVVVGFFSLPRSKLVGYVLPAMPPLAWLAGQGLHALAEASQRQRRWWLAGTAAAALVGLCAVAALAVHPLRSTREPARLLAASRAPGQPVVLLGQYPFDLRFYARLDGPLAVVDDWTGRKARQRDDWRKELADAGDFAPALASQVLAAPAALQPMLCRAGVTWVLGEPDDARRHPFLAAAEQVDLRPTQALWRVDTARSAVNAALACGQTPNAGPADK